MRRLNSRNSGFTLIELSVAIVVFGLIIAVVAKTLPGTTERVRLDNAKTYTIGPAHDVITGFLVANNRLPCPDTTATGVENCAAGVAVGTLPWATMGLPGPVVDPNRVPIRYGVYRSANATASLDADLATSVPNRHQPTFGAVLTITAGNDIPLVLGSMTSAATVTTAQSRLDFCQALNTAAGAVASAGFVHTTADGVIVRNPAYVIASSGIENADGAFSVFDGFNDNPAIPLQFDSPERRRSATYDDIVSVMTFGDLAARLRCATNKGGANSLAIASVLAENIARGQYQGNQAALLAVVQADLAVLMAGISVAISAANALIATANLAIAVTGAVLSIGTTTAQVVAAGIAEATALASVGLAIAQEVLAIANAVTAATAQDAAAVALAAAQLDAAAALNAALAADLQGGVQ